MRDKNEGGRGKIVSLDNGDGSDTLGGTIHA